MMKSKEGTHVARNVRISIKKLSRSPDYKICNSSEWSGMVRSGGGKKLSSSLESAARIV
jgi:hypothetical protein